MNKTTKILSAIIAAALLTGCAADKAVSSDVGETTQTTTVSESVQTTTTAATTNATTSAATETTVTKPEEQPVTEPESTPAEPTQPETSTTPTTPAEPTVPSDPVADQIAQEREENIPVTTPEEADKRQQDKQNRQDMADNTAAYTTKDIPLTTEGDLTAPARPTSSYKLPENAQLEFTGNPETALLTELPEGCFWTPERYGSENAFMDPAGNIWTNTASGFANGTGNRGEGYYSPNGSYHPSQTEIDRAIAFNQQLAERDDNGPTNFEDAQVSEEDLAALDALRR